MEDYKDLCTACLCTGRNLSFIQDTEYQELFMQILHDIPVRPRVCWECLASLRRLRRFATRAHRAAAVLRRAQQGSTTPEPALSELRIHKLDSISISMLQASGVAEPIKTEYTDAIDDGYSVVATADAIDKYDIHDDDKVVYANARRFTVEEDRNFGNIDARLVGVEPRSLGDVEARSFEDFEARGFEVVDASRHTFGDVEARTLDEEARSFVDVEAQSLGAVEARSLDDVEARSLDPGTFVDVSGVDDDVYSETGEHREPESFVNDFVMSEDKAAKSEKRKTSKEKKKKSKVKKKGKNKKSEPKELDTAEDDGLSDREVPLEPSENVVSNKKTSTRQKKAKEDCEEKEAEKTKPAKKPAKARSPPLAAGERPTCAECGKVFSSRKTYKYHLNVLHKGQNRYECARCGKVYQWKSNLGRHMRTHRAVDSGELYCALCDKRFASVATFRQHLRGARSHLSEEQFGFTCEVCGKKFANKTRLRDHRDWEHLNKIKFRCQLCDKPFKCHTSLYVHLQNVHRNKEKKDNLCHVCGKSYQNAAKLKYHIVATHTSATPYRCGRCGAAFGWYSSLYRHAREVHCKIKLQPNKKTKKGRKDDAALMPPPEADVMPL